MRPSQPGLEATSEYRGLLSSLSPLQCPEDSRHIATTELIEENRKFVGGDHQIEMSQIFLDQKEARFQ